MSAYSYETVHQIHQYGFPTFEIVAPDIYVDELPGGRTGRLSRRGGVTYTRRLVARSRSPHAGPAQILTAVLGYLGGYGAQYQLYDNEHPHWELDFAFLDDVIVRQIGGHNDSDSMEWHCDCSFTSIEPVYDDPFLEPPRFTWNGTNVEEIMDFDEEGNPVLNSAGDAFFPAVTRDHTNGLLTVTRAEPIFIIGNSTLLQNTINPVPWLGLEPYMWRLLTVNGEEQFHHAIGHYARVTYNFSYKYDTWLKNVLDAGYRELVETDTDVFERQNVLVEGQKPPDPLPLDGTGRVKSPTAEAVYLEYFPYRPFDFNVLGLS